MFYRTLASLIPVSLAALALLDGCVVTPESTERDDSEATSVPVAVVAEVETLDGARVIFINDGNDGEDGEDAIGVEIVSAIDTPRTDALLAQNPSALELFLALAPGARAPEELVRDHQRLAATSDEHDITPRALELSSAFEASGAYDCSKAAKWKDDFNNWAPDLAGRYVESFKYGDTSGYVGHAPKFYFDVCSAPSPPPKLADEPRPKRHGSSVTVQRRPGPGYSWSVINALGNALDQQQRRWRYYRNTSTCSIHEYRLVVKTHNYHHRGSAWSDEWKCEITQ